jgi:hypothetical protein
MRSRWLGVVAALATIVLTAGCSGVPKTSRPEIVRPVNETGNAVASRPVIGPNSGDDPRTIVSGFLQASVSADAGHTAAKQFLTTDAKRKWLDNAATIVDDYRVNVPDLHGDTATVAVTGRRYGQLDNRGVFTPILRGIGYADSENFTFTLTKSGSDWRIDTPPQGLLLKRLDFETYFTKRPLYFFDPSETRLVTDLRYSELDGQALASWLLTQMVAGPRDELSSSVVNELTDQVDSRRASITVGDQIQVELPGAAQIDSVGQLRLAGQVAWTFGNVQFDSTRITDGGNPVNLPNVGPDFSTTNFQAVGPKGTLPSASVYFYLRGGALISGTDGKPVPGRLGHPQAALTAAALLPTQPNGDARVIAVSGGRVLLGSIQTGLKPLTSAVPGAVLSRPEWDSSSGDAWVGTTKGLFRLTSDRTPHAVRITSSRGGTPPGDIVAVRVSPDGARIAIALREPDVTRLWVGSLVVSGTDVHIDNLEQVTPDALSVTDLAWSNGTDLLTVARNTLDANAVNAPWTVRSDGSFLHLESVEGLPAGPQTVTAAPGQFAIVAVDGTLWVQRSSSWAALDGSGSTPGTSPVYAQ